jgi:hypothetical protein
MMSNLPELNRRTTYSTGSAAMAMGIMKSVDIQAKQLSKGIYPTLRGWRGVGFQNRHNTNPRSLALQNYSHSCESEFPDILSNPLISV